MKATCLASALSPNCTLNPSGSWLSKSFHPSESEHAHSPSSECVCIFSFTAIYNTSNIDTLKVFVDLMQPLNLHFKYMWSSATKYRLITHLDFLRHTSRPSSSCVAPSDNKTQFTHSLVLLWNPGGPQLMFRFAESLLSTPSEDKMTSSLRVLEDRIQWRILSWGLEDPISQ